MFYSVGSYSIYKVNPNVSGGTPTPPSFADTTSWFADGVDDQLLSSSNFGSIDNGTQFSWSFWFKLDTTTPTIQSLIRLNTNTSTQGFHVFYRGGTSLQLEAFVEGSSANWTRSGTGSVKQINKWYHVCVTLDNTISDRYSRLKIYLDGVYQGTSNFFGANMGTGTNISFLSNVDGSAPTNGNIDEIACWGNGNVLTATQVREIFNKGLANDLNNLPTTPQPTNWWRSETATWNGFAWTLTDVNASFEMRSQNMIEANRENDVPSLYSNKSFNFDGVDDYVDCGTDASLAVTNISISAWIKTSGGSGYQSIISADSANSTSRRYQLTVNNISGCISFFYWNSTYVLKSINGTRRVDDGQWHHVMFVNNGTNLKIYVDGVLDVSNANGDTMNIAGTTITAIGSIYGSYGFFLGTIDSVAVWNSDQSANITSIFNQGEPTSLESLNPISHWRMGEDATWNGSQWTLTDNGSGGNNGTSANMVLASRTNDVPLFNTKSITFDGIDDYISVPTITLPTDFSVSMWVKATTGGSVRDQVFGGPSGFFLFGTTVLSGGLLSNKMCYVNGGSYVALTPTLRDGNWHNIVITYNSSATNLIAYTDGVQTYNATYNAGTNNVIDRISEDTYGNYWKGNLDDLAVWDSEINISDVWDGNGKPFDISSSNPISWWRMGDFDSYPTLIDRGSGNNNGTMTNMTSASIVDDVPE